MYGRHFEATDILVSKVSLRPSGYLKGVGESALLWSPPLVQLWGLGVLCFVSEESALDLLDSPSRGGQGWQHAWAPCGMSNTRWHDRATCSSWALVGYILSSVLFVADLADQPAVHRRPEGLVPRRDAEERLAAYCGAKESIWNHLIFPHGAEIGENARKRQKRVDVCGHWCT